jgi:hypothetical protein
MYPKGMEIIIDSIRKIADYLAAAPGTYFSIVAIQRVSPITESDTATRVRQTNWDIAHDWPLTPHSNVSSVPSN